MEILFCDHHIAVCVKPVGVDSEHDMPRYLSEALGGVFLPVHRLDKNVGGVMVYAREKASAALLSKAIQSGQMVKEYVALVHGAVPDEDTWIDLLWKDGSKNKVFVVKRMRGGVKEAKLSYHKLWERDGLSGVRVRLYTGRSHQIRVQFASRGYPLVGDHKYGSKSDALLPKLYSCALTFPYQDEIRTFVSMPEWI